MPWILLRTSLRSPYTRESRLSIPFRNTLIASTILDPTSVHVVDPSALPNSNWLRPGIPSAGKQAFGDAHLAAHKFVLFPSVVSTHSGNLIFVAAVVAGAYVLRMQEASRSTRDCTCPRTSHEFNRVCCQHEARAMGERPDAETIVEPCGCRAEIRRRPAASGTIAR